MVTKKPSEPPLRVVHESRQPKKKKAKKAPAKRGRPLIEVAWDKVDALCAIHCTGPEIAAVLKIDEDTLTAASKRDHGIIFSEYIALKSRSGKASLRRRQWKAAESGDRTMLVWLGKQWLGQVDRIETKSEHVGSNVVIYMPDNGRK